MPALLGRIVIATGYYLCMLFMEPDHSCYGDTKFSPGIGEVIPYPAFRTLCLESFYGTVEDVRNIKFEVKNLFLFTWKKKNIDKFGKVLFGMISV